MMIKRLFLLIILLNVFTVFADTAQDIEGTTAQGEKIILHPNGRWEYVDVKKAEVAKAVADTYPENQQYCPPGAQRANFGYGRCILPGDKDFNRGSLGGKGWK
jgi:hypothetical protein